ncbi:MAG: hypothetical protein IT207_09115 [Fimbriimonadaceae bacterium]|nr:hypothetical protein [Fimbriimonadaceae bacterium]
MSLNCQELLELIDRCMGSHDEDNPAVQSALLKLTEALRNEGAVCLFERRAA